jgi:hypothetical protein
MELHLHSPIRFHVFVRYIIKHMNIFTLELLIWHVFGRNFTFRQTDRQQALQVISFNFNVRLILLFFIIINGTFHRQHNVIRNIILPNYHGNIFPMA